MLNLDSDNFQCGTVAQQKARKQIYEKHFPKMQRNVGMAVPKTTHMDDSVQATQRTTQVTPSLHLFFWDRTSI